MLRADLAGSQAEPIVDIGCEASPLLAVGINLFLKTVEPTTRDGWNEITRLVFRMIVIMWPDVGNLQTFPKCPLHHVFRALKGLRPLVVVLLLVVIGLGVLVQKRIAVLEPSGDIKGPVPAFCPIDILIKGFSPVARISLQTRRRQNHNLAWRQVPALVVDSHP